MYFQIQFMVTGKEETKLLLFQKIQRQLIGLNIFIMEANGSQDQFELNQQLINNI